MELKRWDTQKVIFELECNSWGDLLKGAIEAKISMYRADLRNADLSDADLSDANLRNAKLWNADLRNANLSDANLRNADLRNANLSDANLRNADLSNANLSDADLSDANLRNAKLWNADLLGIGNMKELRTMQLEAYKVGFTKDTLQIGCKRYTIEKWENFTDEEIIEMDGKTALIFWRKWKEFIFKAIELSFNEKKNK
jgi:uncharacterized protein YjbI with pentapeptide repeats